MMVERGEEEINLRSGFLQTRRPSKVKKVYREYAENSGKIADFWDILTLLVRGLAWEERGGGRSKLLIRGDSFTECCSTKRNELRVRHVRTFDTADHSRLGSALAT